MFGDDSLSDVRRRQNGTCHLVPTPLAEGFIGGRLTVLWHIEKAPTLPRKGGADRSEPFGICHPHSYIPWSDWVLGCFARVVGGVVCALQNSRKSCDQEDQPGSVTASHRNGGDVGAVQGNQRNLVGSNH